jgi:transposase-like protein
MRVHQILTPWGVSAYPVTAIIHSGSRINATRRGGTEKMPQPESQPDKSSHTGQQEPVMGRITFGDLYLELPIGGQHKANRKVLGVLGREIKSVHTGTPIFTFQQVADQLAYGDRRDVQNFHRELRQRDFDMQAFVTRKATKHDRVFPLIEAALLETPLLSPHQQYMSFCEAHPTESLSEETFRSYANEIDGLKIVKRVQQLVKPGRETLDLSRYLTEVLTSHRLSGAKKKEIMELVPDVEVPSSRLTGSRFDGLSRSSLQKKLLVVFLYACTLPQAILAPLFGVGKTCIHNWIYEICGEEVEWQILREVVCWSGKVSFDEKWVKIAGQWFFVLCAVDAVSGFPLLIALYPTCDLVSWTLFFRRFKAIYGRPTLIHCDGSRALAAARAVVFSGVRFQLCKFHKLKNLMKRFRQHIHDPKRFTRCVRLAKQMFTNASVSSRKAAAKRLQTLAGADVSAYLEAHILSPWRQLTLSLTTNASERFNRKIEKCFSARYGVPSEESAKVLLRSLWLKELLLHGQQHLDTTSELTSIDLSKICQEHIHPGKILHFFHDNDPSQVEKFA